MPATQSALSLAEALTGMLHRVLCAYAEESASSEVIVLILIWKNVPGVLSQGGRLPLSRQTPVLLR